MEQSPQTSTPVPVQAQTQTSEPTPELPVAREVNSNIPTTQAFPVANVVGAEPEPSHPVEQSSPSSARGPIGSTRGPNQPGSIGLTGSTGLTGPSNSQGQSGPPRPLGASEKKQQDAKKQEAKAEADDEKYTERQIESDIEAFKDAITNRYNITQRLNQKEQIDVAVKNIENICCFFIKNTYLRGSKELIKVLVEQTNTKIGEKSVQNSINGTLLKIMGDVLDNEDTREIILKHLRGGCFKVSNIEDRINEKREFIANLKKQEFVDSLNRLSQNVKGGGSSGGGEDNEEEAEEDDTEKNGEEKRKKPKQKTNQDTYVKDENKINIDTPESIQRTLCEQVFVKMFRDHLFTQLSIKQIARDMIQTTIRTNPNIRMPMTNTIIDVLKQTFNAKRMKPIIIEKLSGGCYHREATKKETEKPAEKESVSTLLAKLISQSLEKPSAPPEQAVPPPPKKEGGYTRKKIHSHKIRRFTKKRHEMAAGTAEMQGGNIFFNSTEPIKNLSFKTLVYRAYPIIKSCLCDCVKDLYRRATPQIFKRYNEYCRIELDNPNSDIYDYALPYYARIIERYLKSPEKQIKLDIRDNILGKCPPIQDPEIRFTGSSIVSEKRIVEEPKKQLGGNDKFARQHAYPEMFIPLMHLSSM